MFSGTWQVHSHFSNMAMHNIEYAIKTAENTHLGEIRFVVESGLHPMEILGKKTPKKRALELFGRFNIWDTEFNTGVLIYLLLADRDVEIVADRGIHQHVGNDGWAHICHQMELKFRHGEFEAGVLQGIAAISQHLQQHFPAGAIPASQIALTKRAKKPAKPKKKNEIPDSPIIL